MDINAAFPSSFLKCADLNGRHVPVTMADVKIEDIGDDEKPVLYFRNCEKGLVLNKTNSNSIVELYGSDTDHWYDKPIVLVPAKTEYQGKRVDCIRIDPAPRAAISEPAAGPLTGQPMRAATHEDHPF